MEAVRTSETSVDNYFTQEYIPEDNSEHHTRRRDNLKSHKVMTYVLLNRQIHTTIGTTMLFQYTIIFRLNVLHVSSSLNSSSGTVYEQSLNLLETRNMWNIEYKDYGILK
jgi:hypothetical protein